MAGRNAQFPPKVGEARPYKSASKLKIIHHVFNPTEDLVAVCYSSNEVVVRRSGIKTCWKQNLKDAVGFWSDPWKAPEVPSNTKVEALCWAPDGSVLVAAMSHNVLHFMSTATGVIMYTMPVKKTYTEGLRWLLVDDKSNTAPAAAKDVLFDTMLTSDAFSFNQEASKDSENAVRNLRDFIVVSICGKLRSSLLVGFAEDGWVDLYASGLLLFEELKLDDHWTIPDTFDFMSLTVLDVTWSNQRQTLQVLYGFASYDKPSWIKPPETDPLPDELTAGQSTVYVEYNFGLSHFRHRRLFQLASLYGMLTYFLIFIREMLQYGTTGLEAANDKFQERFIEDIQKTYRGFKGPKTFFYELSEFLKEKGVSEAFVEMNRRNKTQNAVKALTEYYDNRLEIVHNCLTHVATALGVLDTTIMGICEIYSHDLLGIDYHFGQKETPPSEVKRIYGLHCDIAVFRNLVDKIRSGICSKVDLMKQLKFALCDIANIKTDDDLDNENDASLPRVDRAQLLYFLAECFPDILPRRRLLIGAPPKVALPRRNLDARKKRVMKLARKARPAVFNFGDKDINFLEPELNFSVKDEPNPKPPKKSYFEEESDFDDYDRWNEEDVKYKVDTFVKKQERIKSRWISLKQCGDFKRLLVAFMQPIGCYPLPASLRHYTANSKNLLDHVTGGPSTSAVVSRSVRPRSYAAPVVETPYEIIEERRHREAGSDETDSEEEYRKTGLVTGTGSLQLESGKKIYKDHLVRISKRSGVEAELCISVYYWRMENRMDFVSKFFPEYYWCGSPAKKVRERMRFLEFSTFFKTHKRLALKQIGLDVKLPHDVPVRRVVGKILLRPTVFLAMAPCFDAVSAVSSAVLWKYDFETQVAVHPIEISKPQPSFFFFGDAEVVRQRDHFTPFTPPVSVANGGKQEPSGIIDHERLLCHPNLSNISRMRTLISPNARQPKPYKKRPSCDAVIYTIQKDGTLMAYMVNKSETYSPKMHFTFKNIPHPNSPAIKAFFCPFHCQADIVSAAQVTKNLIICLTEVPPGENCQPLLYFVDFESNNAEIAPEDLVPGVELVSVIASPTGSAAAVVDNTGTRAFYMTLGVERDPVTAFSSYENYYETRMLRLRGYHNPAHGPNEFLSDVKNYLLNS